MAILALGIVTAVAGCMATAPIESRALIDFEKYELENGLDVILHVDRSDPIAAVVMTFHVGSAKEVAGKTGFAHLFEHLFFLDSENLGPGGLDRLMTRIGSSTSGSTNRDRTNYFEVVPIDGLEKALWAEADKLGFFINTVTESIVAKEKQVVKNEKRQSVDNRPYGHNNYVIDRALYPEGHPYRWQVIGSLADLDSASAADAMDFHQKWYGPNNATLVVAGDLDIVQTKVWIERYFAEIPPRETPPVPELPSSRLAATTRLFHEDNYARVPMLTLAWPTVEAYAADSYALAVLADILTEGKSTPFYQVLVEETKVAPGVSARHRASELAGQFRLSVRAFADTDLDTVQHAVESAFARFEDRGVPEDELERVKAGYETGVYSRLSSVRAKAFQLAEYNLIVGDPGYAEEDLRRSLEVTEADVLRVYDRYVKNRPYVATSFVPQGRPELALADSVRAEVVEEPIVIGAEGELTAVIRGEARTPSAIDRSVEPPYGDPPSRTPPRILQDTLANGVPVFAIEDDEFPLVRFELRMKGGQLLEDPLQVGVANLLAESMTAGTASRTPQELEHAIEMLGASIDVTSSPESFAIRGTVLSRNYQAAMELVEEILLEPRYDAAEFALSLERVRNLLRQRAADPVSIADDVFRGLLYRDHILAANPLGSLETIESIALEDLSRYHDLAIRPTTAAFHVAGAIEWDGLLASLEGIAERWAGAAPPPPNPPQTGAASPGLYFVDVPGASQSALRIGYLALAETAPEYYPVTVMNFRFGGGGFASDLTQVLREQRGYTYGIHSRFRGTDQPGPFEIASSVRSNVTLESLAVIQAIIEAYGREFDPEDLEATQSFLLRANAGAFETGEAKLGLLADMSAYGFPADYVIQREEIVRSMTIEDIRELAQSYLDPTRMAWLVVGDRETQLERLRSLGLGEPVLLDREGLPVEAR